LKWNASLYDTKCGFVTRYGEDLVELLAPASGERILDIGCGTGHLTKKIAEAGARVVGMDNSADMIAAARAAHPDLEFITANAADFALDPPFDAIFSNAALHWVTEAEAAVICMARALKLEGRFVAEFGGRGNVARITSALRDALRDLFQVDFHRNHFYPGLGEYAGLLEKHGLSVRSAWLYERPTELPEGETGLRHWIEMFWGSDLSDLSANQKERLLVQVENRLRPELFRDERWFADYRRLRIVAVKE